MPLDSLPGGDAKVISAPLIGCGDDGVESVQIK